MSLTDDFREIRRVSTPIVCVQTQDYRAIIRKLLAVRRNGKEDQFAAVMWNCIDGPQTIQGDPISIGTSDDSPSMVLKNAMNLEEGTILFLVVPDTFDQPGNFWSNPYIAQATANLRDPFKSNKRTLAILSLDGKLPPLVSDDVPVLRDPLPEREELQEIAEKLAKDAMVSIEPQDIGKAASLCLGMTRFAAEEAFSRKLRKTGFDLSGLSLAQREVIEQTSERAITFDTGNETFDDIGGLENIKQFSNLLFNGKRPPSVVVRIEEIEKAMAGAGSVGDTSGVSQDQLGVLLTAMEDNGWSGFVAVGHAGCSKSLVSKAMGRSHSIPSVSFDLGACKNQYVGASERMIRRNVGILKTFAGNGAFFIATSNDISIIKPALLRRFRCGVFMFDLLLPEEREQVWKINLKKFSIDDQKKPNDNDFAGSDIRDICELASDLRCSLIEAAKFQIPVAKRSPAEIAKLRDAAHGRFLSANVPGVYQKPEAKANRSVSL